MNELAVINHKNQRVLTTPQLARAFETDTQNISRNFTRNASRYVHGKHFFTVTGDEKRELLSHVQSDDGLIYASVLYLWTEKGAWMLAKSLNTDRAWDAYEQLVDDYYEVKATQIDVSQLSPEMQMFHQIFRATAEAQLELQEMKETVNAIQETFLQRDPDWRKSINTMLNKAAYRGGISYRDLRTQSYQLLEERGHCDLSTRLRNLVQRLEDSGSTKTVIKEANKMDVIESDVRLKEIYSTIVKELSIGTLHALEA